jgi:hypothetical protein
VRGKSADYADANRRRTLTLPNAIVLIYGYDNDSPINSISCPLGTIAVGCGFSQSFTQGFS